MDEFEESQDDISNSFAAEITGTVGLPDDAAADGLMYDSLASAVEDYDRHALEHADDNGQFKDDDVAKVEEDEQPRKGHGKVPIGALQAERAKRQQLQQQLDAQAQQLAQYQQQLAQLQQYQQQLAQGQQQQLQQEAIPDFDEDPRGYIEAKERQLTEQLQNVQYQQQYQNVTAQLQQESQQLAPVVAEVEDAFRAEVGADQYDQAYQMVHQTIQANMRAHHPNASPQEMALLEQVVSIQFVRQCQARGVNPAEHVWNLAHQMGFNPAVPGQRAPSTRLPPKAPTSLSTLAADSRAPDQMGRVAAKDVANLSNEQFDQLWNSMKESGTQRPAV